EMKFLFNTSTWRAVLGNFGSKRAAQYMQFLPSFDLKKKEMIYFFSEGQIYISNHPPHLSISWHPDQEQ
ncbi:hypothetical protein ACJX0J_031893, partial [Zea mays]